LVADFKNDKNIATKAPSTPRGTFPLRLDDSPPLALLPFLLNSEFCFCLG